MWPFYSEGNVKIETVGLQEEQPQDPIKTVVVQFDELLKEKSRTVLTVHKYIYL